MSRESLCLTLLVVVRLSQSRLLHVPCKTAFYLEGISYLTEMLEEIPLPMTNARTPRSPWKSWQPPEPHAQGSPPSSGDCVYLGPLGVREVRVCWVRPCATPRRHYPARTGGLPTMPTVLPFFGLLFWAASAHTTAMSSCQGRL